jgi:hypothetical protein
MTTANRCWPRFGLRTLIAAVTILCLLLGWIGNNLHQISTRETAFNDSHAAARLLPASAQPFLWSILGACLGTKGGHRYWEELLVPPGTPRTKVSELKLLFPEATVEVMGGKPWES